MMDEAEQDKGGKVGKMSTTKDYLPQKSTVNY